MCSAQVDAVAPLNIDLETRSSLASTWTCTIPMPAMISAKSVLSAMSALAAPEHAPTLKRLSDELEANTLTLPLFMATVRPRNPHVYLRALARMVTCRGALLAHAHVAARCPRAAQVRREIGGTLLLEALVLFLLLPSTLLPLALPVQAFLPLTLLPFTFIPLTLPV